jgi:hypothetical protein
MESMSEDSFAEPPFPLTAQLLGSLSYTPKEQLLRRTDTTTHIHNFRLPGSPQTLLNDTTGVFKKASADSTTPKLDNLIKRNRFTLRFHSDPICSLSENGALVRKIVVTEEPGLHCIWDDDRIFIKPLPSYLTSHAFWCFLLEAYTCDNEERQNIIASMQGFLRSYSYLIRYESDYHIAIANHLIPSQTSFEELVIFLGYFHDLPDSVVSTRYKLGILQLQTLNWISFFSAPFHPYYRLHRNRYNAFFLQYYGPTLFIFATFSVALSAMQVALAVRAGEAPVEKTTDGGLDGRWRSMGYAFRWFSIWSMTFAASMGVVLVVLLFGLLGTDWVESWARWKKHGKDKGAR